MTKKYEVVVVGGGMVGAVAACALAEGGVQVALLECRQPERQWAEDSVDIRVSALTKASQNILQTVGAWEAMEEKGISPFHDMRVWDTEADGKLHFDCAETEFSELGHIVENRITVAALWELMESLPTLSILCPAKVTATQITNDCRRLLLDDDRSIEAELVIAADGRDSVLREMIGIDVTGWSYNQDGLVATVATENSHQATAWQRFLPEGPLAFLPLRNGHCSIVWTLSSVTAKEHLKLTDAEFLLILEQASDGILGKMQEVGPRASFPLRFQYANRYTDERFALIGDAAHAMHPLAGQGANAGLLDAAAIAELIISCRKHGRPVGGHRVLRQYERWRKADNLIMMSSMDIINKIYGRSLRPIAPLRSAGMNWINRSRTLKNYFNRYAMGLRDDLPKLAYGSVCW
jgi:2-polyprenylphenol 6-hydroxylase